ncbi:hypothetical protein [Algoriphagus antarcticus]|uniref:Uncharacterized protein n=1 Tax=Algoriphagus antarcticus TaxID=238540 RepID=A0A3E0E1U6_9BACT|nr:hypothetical protein [Algoriphagus antarcticus]REG92155.1 hypothetical protein C8N25_103234 [Algoriphagus antarcticus]
MRDVNDLVGFRLESLELAKLKIEYESKGFKFIENKRKKIGESSLVLDGYAINSVTGEEIIFIVRSERNTSSEEKVSFWENIKLYKSYFPKAKVHLVVPKEVEVPNIKFDFLQKILKEEIQLNHMKELAKRISYENLEIVDVSKVSIDFVQFKNEELEIKGQAHLIISIGIDYNFIIYELPFKFSLKGFTFWYSQKNNNKQLSIKIDYYEFS